MIHRTPKKKLLSDSSSIDPQNYFELNSKFEEATNLILKKESDIKKLKELLITKDNQITEIQLQYEMLSKQFETKIKNAAKTSAFEKLA